MPSENQLILGCLCLNSAEIKKQTMESKSRAALYGGISLPFARELFEQSNLLPRAVFSSQLISLGYQELNLRAVEPDLKISSTYRVEVQQESESKQRIES